MKQLLAITILLAAIALQGCQQIAPTPLVSAQRKVSIAEAYAPSPCFRTYGDTPSAAKCEKEATIKQHNSRVR